MNAIVTLVPRTTAKLGVFGLGNIGSAVVPHLARMPSLTDVTLVDCGRYDVSNQGSQEIQARDVSRPKVDVQRRRMRQIAPMLDIRCHAERLETVPWGEFRMSALLACLDTRASRMHVNEVAWRLAVPWIDAAVDATGWLVRVNVYLPGSPDAACYECPLHGEDYAAVEQEYPCQLGGVAASPTNAPSFLGAAAAAIQAAECQKLLTGDRDHLLAGRQVLVDLRHHKQYVTQFRRNPDCRFDHRIWEITRLATGPRQLSLREAFDLMAPGGSKQLQVPGHSFARRLACRACMHASDVLCLQTRLPARQAVCPHCGGAMQAVGFDLVDWLDAEWLSARKQRRTLHSVGLRPRDLFAIRNADEPPRYFELGAST